MKNITALSFIFLLINFSCYSQLNKDDLIGNWKVIKFEANTPELSPMLIKGAKDEALSTSYLFKKDRAFAKKSNFFVDGILGKYEYVAEKGFIKMTSEANGGSEIEKYQIESLSKKLMKWTQDMGELGSLSMTLKKE